MKPTQASRAQRRHNNARMLTRIQKRMLRNCSSYAPQNVPEYSRMLRDNPATCSHPWCCGNPRGFAKGQYNFTMQERRHGAGVKKIVCD